MNTKSWMIGAIVATTVAGAALADGGAKPADPPAPEAAKAAEEKAPAEKPAPVVKTDAEVIAEQLPTYPLETCVVSGEPLGAMGKPVDFVHEGRLVRFCCPNCEKQFLGDPDKYLAAVDEAAAKAQEKSASDAGAAAPEQAEPGSDEVAD